ncbi:LIC_10190 family membrane protein [Empedobacter falsenii]
MVFQFFLSIALFFYFLGFGFLFQKIFPRINSTISFTVINGMIGVGLISFFVAFFLPLNFTYEVVLISIAILSLIYHRNEVKRSLLKLKNISRYFYAFTFVGLLVAVTYPFILDHFGYYIPTIKWLDFAGFVKGLSNFEWVLAQNSFWHILQASISETLDIYYRLNFCLFLIFNLYVFELKQKKLLIFNLLFLFFLNTPSPDLPVFVLTILLINEYLRYKNKASDYLFYAAILFVIKPISIVLLLFFGIEYLRNKEYKNLKDKNLFLLIFIALLFCCKGVIVSANPLFPLEFSSIKGLKWASPQYLYELSAQNGRFIPLKDSFTFEEVARMNTTEYFQAIFFQSSSRTIIFLLIICLTIFNLLIGFYKKNYFVKSLIFCCIVKLLIILIFSNQFRFLLDVLIIDLLIIFKLVNLKIFNKYSELLSLIFVYITSFILIFSIFKGDYFKNIKSFSYIRSINFDQILIPGNYKENELNINNLKISKTKLEKFLQYQIYLQQIDSTDVKKGFYFEKMDRKKREKILNILKEEQKKQVK